jgi:hypothetical protein
MLVEGHRVLLRVTCEVNAEVLPVALLVATGYPEIPPLAGTSAPAPRVGLADRPKWDTGTSPKPFIEK